MVPISETKFAAGLFTYIAASGLERLHVFQLRVQRLENRGGVGGGFTCRSRRLPGPAIESAIPAGSSFDIASTQVHGHKVAG